MWEPCFKKARKAITKAITKAFSMLIGSPSNFALAIAQLSISSSLPGRPSPPLFQLRLGDCDSEAATEQHWAGTNLQIIYYCSSGMPHSCLVSPIIEDGCWRCYARVGVLGASTLRVLASIAGMTRDSLRDCSQAATLRHRDHTRRRASSWL